MSETEVERGDEDSEERRGSRFCHQLCHGLVNAIKRCALVLPSCPPQKHFLMNSLMHIVSLCLHTLWQMVATNLYPHRQDSAFLIMTALKLFSQMKNQGGTLSKLFSYAENSRRSFASATVALIEILCVVLTRKVPIYV